MEKYLTAEELKKMLKVSETGLKGMISRGEIPQPDFGGQRGRPRRWKLSSIQSLKN